jgi:hypothetical protein
MPLLLPWALIRGLSPFNFNLNLARRDSQGQAFFGSYCQAFSNGRMNVLLRLGFRLSLADATRDRRAFGDIHAIFILKYGYKKSHLDASGRN